jgi:hypothetical protein
LTSLADGGWLGISFAAFGRQFFCKSDQRIPPMVDCDSVLLRGSNLRGSHEATRVRRDRRAGSVSLIDMNLRLARAIEGFLEQLFGHILAEIIVDMEALIGNRPERILADAGYHGHTAPPDYRFGIYTACQKRRDTADQARDATPSTPFLPPPAIASASSSADAFVAPSAERTQRASASSRCLKMRLFTDHSDSP